MARKTLINVAEEQEGGEFEQEVIAWMCSGMLRNNSLLRYRCHDSHSLLQVQRLFTVNY